MNVKPRHVRTIGTRVFVARLAGTAVFDPLGDQVGRVHDVVVLLRLSAAPRAIGLVVEVSARRRVFVPLSRVTAIEPGAVITTGLVNIRRFSQRAVETLVVGEILDRVVTLKDGTGQARIADLCMEQGPDRDWIVTDLYVERGRPTSLGFRRAGSTLMVQPAEVTGLAASALPQEATALLATMEDLKPADLADVMHDLPQSRRIEVAQQLSDERLADLLEELGEDDRVGIVSALPANRAADVLDVMQPDDAADLVSELPEETAKQLLDLMEPEEAKDVRRLLAYEEDTAGGLMTTEPVVLPPDATVAALLANVRKHELPPALAALACVVRPPLETPTGRFIGVVHIQRALRERPQTLLGSIVDADVDGVSPDVGIGTLVRLLATYNLTALPVVDDDQRLLGAVSVDDVLDQLLPDDWREADEAVTDEALERSVNG